MRVELERKSVVANVFRAVDGLGHTPQRQVLEGVELRLAAGCPQQLTQGDRRSGTAGRIGHFVTEACRKAAQSLQFLEVGFIVHTVDEGLGALERHTVHPASGSHELCHGAVGKQHELFYEVVGFFCNFLIHTYRLALIIHLDLHFRTVEVDGTGLEACRAHDPRKAVQREDGVLYRGALLRLGRVIDYGLGLLVVEPGIGADDGTSYPTGFYGTLWSHLKH